MVRNIVDTYVERIEIERCRLMEEDEDQLAKKNLVKACSFHENRRATVSSGSPSFSSTNMDDDDEEEEKEKKHPKEKKGKSKQKSEKTTEKEGKEKGKEKGKTKPKRKKSHSFISPVHPKKSSTKVLIEIIDHPMAIQKATQPDCHPPIYHHLEPGFANNVDTRQPPRSPAEVRAMRRDEEEMIRVKSHLGDNTTASSTATATTMTGNTPAPHITTEPTDNNHTQSSTTTTPTKTKKEKRKSILSYLEVEELEERRKRDSWHECILDKGQMGAMFMMFQGGKPTTATKAAAEEKEPEPAKQSDEEEEGVVIVQEMETIVVMPQEKKMKKVKNKRGD